ncbi:hypothetical protein AB0A77_25150 [Streptomyces varsoviensis]|uniref:hypothetical protein n=1 Tax=Streptomyces varsoviensis TaxID=67373 RepID=UPI0033E1D753
MTGHNPTHTTFSFAPPTDDALAWHLRLDDLAEKITQSFPGAFTQLQHELGPRDADALSFAVPVSDGEWLEGLATTPYEGMGSVMVLDASAAEAAVFAVWLRDSFIPSPELIEFTSEFALNNGDTATWKLPRSGPAGEIAEALQQHIDSVGAS